MKLRLQLFFDALRYSYLTVPMLLAVMGLALACLMLYVDSMSLNMKINHIGPIATGHIVTGLIYSGGADGARALLGAIAGSIISVAALASSIAITALALASGQFGSRLLRNFMDDRGFQATLGTFNGTFLFCLVILRATRSADELDGGVGSGVPQISVTVALGLAVVCVFLLIYFLHHMARAIQAPYVIADAAHDLNQEIDRLYGKSTRSAASADAERVAQLEEEMPAWEFGIAIEAPCAGYLKAINYEILLAIAIREDRIFKLAHDAGDWINRGEPIVMVWPPRDPQVYQHKVQSSFIVGRSRTAVQDIEYGINQLVEVATRALSPGINDPFSAMTCLDYMGASLRHVLRCDLPSPYLLDDAGQLRVIAHTVQFPDLCDAAFNMIRQYGADSPAVMIRLLETLAAVGAKCRTSQEKEAIARHARLARDEALKQASIDADKEEINGRFLTTLKTVAEHN